MRPHQAHNRAQRWMIIGGLLLALGVFASCGAPAARPADIRMEGSEFRFTMDERSFAAATPYRFVVRNAGATPHEWVVTHAAEASADHAHDAHDAAVGAIDSADFGPGAEATRDITFPSPGTYEIACRLPGHYEAGMHLTITVQ